MSSITYNFTDGHNKDVKDNAPDWMNTLFENGIEKKEVTIVKNLYDNNVNIKKCNKCGKILLNNSTKCPSCDNL